MTEEQYWGIILAAQSNSGGEAPVKARNTTDLTTLTDTLTWATKLWPRQRIVLVANEADRNTFAAILSSWPAENICYQPADRGTAPAILLALAHITYRARFSTVTIIPAGSCYGPELLTGTQRAIAETQLFPRYLTFLGTSSSNARTHGAWVENRNSAVVRKARVVTAWHPSLPSAFVPDELLTLTGTLRHTGVCVALANTVWEMARQTEPDLYRDFMTIRRSLQGRTAKCVIEDVYRWMRPIDFDWNICRPLLSRLRVLAMQPEQSEKTPVSLPLSQTA